MICRLVHNGLGLGSMYGKILNYQNYQNYHITAQYIQSVLVAVFMTKSATRKITNIVKKIMRRSRKCHSPDSKRSQREGQKRSLPSLDLETVSKELTKGRSLQKLKRRKRNDASDYNRRYY